MNKSTIQLIVVMVLLSSIAIWITQRQVTTDIRVTPSVAEAERMKIGDKCMDAAERSVANLTPIIEFQRLELQSRRTTTLTHCMQDNGYIENPAWTYYAQPLANNNSVKQHISTDESLQTLRQQDMQVFKPLTDQPSFWLKQK